MSCEKDNIRRPLSNCHKKDTSSNHVSRKKRNTPVCCPTCWIFNITNFDNFQIVNSSNQTISLSKKNKKRIFSLNTLPKNSCFSLKCVDRWNSSQTDHQHSPSQSNSWRTSILSFQIPKILGSRIFFVRRTYNFLQNQSPNTKIHKNVKNHVCPQNTNCCMTCFKNSFRRRNVFKRKKTSSRISRRRTQGHKKQPHMSNTTICKQTFQICLCQGGNSSNNHRNSSKKGKSISKMKTPNFMPVMSPKTKNRNFRQNCNPQRNNRPCSLVNIRNPEMQGGGSLFPKQSNSYKPNSKRQPQRRFKSCSFSQIFNMRQICFSGLPVEKTYTQKQQNASKSTQQKIFHCRFQRVCTFRVQSTQNNQRKTLQLQTKIQRHQISGRNHQILTNLCLHCQINIFSMTNFSHFLPSSSKKQNSSSSSQQKNRYRSSICIFLKSSAQNNRMQRVSKNQKSSESAPQNSPQSQRRNCMVWSSWRFSFTRNVRKKIPLKIGFLATSRNKRNTKIFRNRTHNISGSISQQNKETKKQKEFWSKKNQIKGHFF